MRMVDIAAVDQVPQGAAVQYLADDTPVVLCRAGEAVYALGFACPYHPVPLDGSRVEGTSLVCRWYGAVFDVRTGATVRPARVPPLRSFPVAVRDGRVWVDLGANA